MTNAIVKYCTCSIAWTFQWQPITILKSHPSLSASAESTGGVISKTMDLVCGPPKGPRWVLHMGLDREINLFIRADLTLRTDSSEVVAATLRVPMSRGQLAREAAIFLKEPYEWERWILSIVIFLSLSVIQINVREPYCMIYWFGESNVPPADGQILALLLLYKRNFLFCCLQNHIFDWYCLLASEPPIRSPGFTKLRGTPLTKDHLIRGPCINLLVVFNFRFVNINAVTVLSVTCFVIFFYY